MKNEYVPRIIPVLRIVRRNPPHFQTIQRKGRPRPKNWFLLFIFSVQPVFLKFDPFLFGITDQTLISVSNFLNTIVLGDRFI